MPLYTNIGSVNFKAIESILMKIILQVSVIKCIWFPHIYISPKNVWTLYFLLASDETFSRIFKEKNTLDWERLNPQFLFRIDTVENWCRITCRHDNIKIVCLVDQIMSLKLTIRSFVGAVILLIV